MGLPHSSEGHTGLILSADDRNNLGSFHGVRLTLLQTYILQNTPLKKVKVLFLQFILCQNCSLRHSKTNLLNYLTKNKVISKFDKSVRLTFEIPRSKF